MPKLKKLNLKKNKIEKIEEEGLPELPSLEKINLHGNKIPDMPMLFGVPYTLCFYLCNLLLETV